MPAHSASRRLARRLLTEEQRHRLKHQRHVLLQPVMFVRARNDADLDALARHHGTDKSSEGHGYTRYYARHFASRRHRVRSVLEIGVGGTTSVLGYETPHGGQSLRMWSRYFPHAEIVGIDIHHKDVAGPRIHFERGSQSDAAFLRSVIARHGPFDIVIDDGSHVGRDIITSMAVLWDAVRPGGFYVVEDLGTAYHPGWEGGPPGTPGTAAALIKAKVDDTLRREQDPFEPAIAAMHVYPEIVFFEKRARSWVDRLAPGG